MESDFQELQSRYLRLKQTQEGQEEKLRFFAEENAVDAGELEEALMTLRRRKEEDARSLPSFLEDSTVEAGGGSSKQRTPTTTETAAGLGPASEASRVRAELSELQVQYVEAVAELDKTRSLLKVQVRIRIQLRTH